MADLPPRISDSGTPTSLIAPIPKPTELPQQLQDLLKRESFSNQEALDAIDNEVVSLSDALDFLCKSGLYRSKETEYMTPGVSFWLYNIKTKGEIKHNIFSLLAKSEITSLSDLNTNQLKSTLRYILNDPESEYKLTRDQEFIQNFTEAISEVEKFEVEELVRRAKIQNPQITEAKFRTDIETIKERNRKIRAQNYKLEDRYKDLSSDCYDLAEADYVMKQLFESI